jgi:hypothetical protein
MRSRNNSRVETTAAAIRGAVDEPLPIDDERERELREFSRATVKKRVQRHELGSIRRKLRASAAGHVSQAAAQVAGREGERISDSDYNSFRKAVAAAIVELDQEERLAEFEHHAAVVSEPSPYAPDSPNSYYADIASSTAARLAAPEVLGVLAARTSSDVDMSASAVEAARPARKDGMSRSA